jgi:DNA-binding FadR family transcriptional regulator
VAESLRTSAASEDAVAFNRARRQFYRALLEIGDNAELQRLFPAVGMDLIHIQHASAAMRRLRREDYLFILAAVQAGDVTAAQAAARRHVDNVRRAIDDFGASKGAVLVAASPGLS